MPARGRQDPAQAGTRSARVRLLAGVPLFAALPTHDLERLAGLCTERALGKGETVCRRGDPGDRLYVVTRGELEVWGGPEDARLLGRLQPGEFVGELSLLVGGERSATVTVARAARLLAIEKAVFDRFLRDNPAALTQLSLVLARRLATMARGDVAERRTTVVAVTARDGLCGKSLIAGTLAVLLRRFSRRQVLLVRLVREEMRLGRPQPGTPLADLVHGPTERLRGAVGGEGPLAPLLTIAVAASGRLADDLPTLAARLGYTFPVIVLDVGAGPGWLSRVVGSASDVVVEIVERAAEDEGAGARPGRRAFEVLNLRNPGSVPVPCNHCRPFVLRDDPALRDLDPAAQAEYLAGHPWSAAGPTLHRLARAVLGGTVGIALGGGAAFGVSHVGVLKALEQTGFPIDLVAGTSMGAIVGVAYAAGVRPAEMLEFARRVGVGRATLSVLRDLTLSKPGILSGERVAEMLSPVLGRARTFEDLVLPCRAVAADVETGERVAIGTGRLDVAYRASAAVPVLWAPVRVDGRVLIDGSMIDPVPGDVVREMGADLCVAVNVVPALRKGIETVISRWHRRLSRFNPLAHLSGSQGLPSMLDQGMNTVQMVQRELGNYKAVSADLCISPDLAEFTWVEFHRAEELIERGAAAAERALPALRALLEKRLEQRPSPDPALTDLKAAGEPLPP
jgi:NTE family protein